MSPKPAPGPNERLLKRSAVEDMTALSSSTIYRLIGECKFPAPIRLKNTEKRAAVRWRESDVQAWIAEQIASNAAEA